jgi:solute carrier family 35
MSAAAAKLTAAGMYGVSSILIMFVNKFTLTVFAFPSFTALGLAQCVATVVLIAGLKTGGVVNYPDFDASVAKKLFPLPIFFILNVLSGLGGTKRINVRSNELCDKPCVSFRVMFVPVLR